ncbi:MAG: DUF2207 domain-containing protein [Oscillospiraceae bacterium]
MATKRFMKIAKRAALVASAVSFMAMLFPCTIAFAQDYSLENYDYYIKNYDAHIVANSDRSYDVTETIDVFFNTDKHGIIRNIPTDSDVEKEIRIENVEVVGDEYEYDGYGNIQIGNPELTLKGDKTYIIKYTLWHYADTDAEHDYLYLNLIGTQWDVPIEKVSAVVSLPMCEVSKCELNDGEYGIDGNSLSKYEVKDGRIFVSNTEALMPGQGITLMVEMNEGAFSNAEIWKPEISINSADIQISMDEYANAAATEEYSILVNSNDAKFRRYFDIYGNDYNSKLTNVFVTINGVGRQKQYSQYMVEVNLESYVGETVNIKLEYEKEYNIAPGNGIADICIPIFDYSDDCECKSVSVSYESSVEFTDISAIQAPYPDMYDALNIPVKVDGKKATMQCLEEQSTDNIYLCLSYDSSAFLRREQPMDKALPAIGAAVLAAAGAFIAFSKRRRIVKTVEFYPPEDINPAEAGLIIDAAIDGRDVVSLIYYWAAQGHLRIEFGDGKDNFKLHKLSELDAKHRAYEISMFKKMFDIGDGECVSKTDLDEVFYITIKSTREKIMDMYAKGKKSALIDKGSAVRSAILGIGFPVLLAMITLKVCSASSYSAAGGVFATLASLIGCFAVYTISSSLKNRRFKDSKALKAVKIAAGTAIFAVSFFIFISGVGDGIMTKMMAGIIAFAMFMGSSAGPFLKSYTEYGAALIGRIAGFKDFLQTAERDKLVMLLEENPEYYYDILPYANVLGVSKIWEKKFDGLLNSPPAWIDGNTNGLSNVLALNMLSNSISRSMTSAPPPESSSGGFSGGGGGFSGGGFSGGGSGGGGGSSW